MKKRIFKKVGLILALALVMAVSTATAQNRHFRMSLLKPDKDSAFVCDVTAKYENGVFEKYTGCTIFPYTRTKAAKVRVSIDGDEIPRFLLFLEAVKTKFGEWDSIAKANRVRAFQKRMPVELKSKGGIWSLYYVEGKPPRSSFDMDRQWVVLIPFFSVDKDGISFVEWNTGKLEYYSRGGLHGLGNDVEAERCEGGTFKFKSPKEIQSLIDCFSVSTGNSKKNTSDLFK